MSGLPLLVQGHTTVCEGGMIVVNATHLCSKCYVYTESQGSDLQCVCSHMFHFVYSHAFLRRLLRARCLWASTVSPSSSVWMQIFTGRVGTFVRFSIIVRHVLFNGMAVSANGKLKLTVGFCLPRTGFLILLRRSRFVGKQIQFGI